jgi:ribosomal-protein-alanine acetyltransferase
MSAKDQELLRNAPNIRIIPNGVDVRRFHPQREDSGKRILFVGSFRHFPNVVAFRWFLEQVWPLVKERVPDAHFVTIAGPTPELYYQHKSPDPQLELHGFVSDVRSFYASANLVVVPTQVSAGTNLKVLEALACERSVVSTTSGCAGLGLRHGTDVWIADDPEAFAEAIELLLKTESMRSNLAQNGRALVERVYDWHRIGRLQAALWNEILTGISVRPGRQEDIPEIRRIQLSTSTASHWEPETYFDFRVTVAERDGRVAGFLVMREIAGEIEVLNLATAPEFRRQGVAKTLLASIEGSEVFLEVRESNNPARKLYENLGFTVVGVRSEYYDDPIENAFVMRLSRRASS